MSSSRIYKIDGLEISSGNIKVGGDTLILNMNSATDCPSAALGFCKLGKKCYALKAERLYKGCLPYRRRQEAYWDSHSAIEISAAILKVVKRIRHEIKYIRLSEAGDFKSQQDVDKAELIAIHLKKHGLAMYTYTARQDLDFSGCVALRVKGSGHGKGNNGKTIARPGRALPERGVYTENSEKFVVCPGSCRSCNFCKLDNGLNIVFALH